MTTTYKQIKSNEVLLSTINNNGSHTSVLIKQGELRTRPDENGELEEYSPWDELQTEVSEGNVTIEQKSQAEIDAEALDVAIANRELSIAKSTITVTSGNVYHSDKQSVVMLGNARQRLTGLPLNTPVNWSLYGTPSGFMSQVTYEEIIEAHNLAVDQLSLNWEI